MKINAAIIADGIVKGFEAPEKPRKEDYRDQPIAYSKAVIKWNIAVAEAAKSAVGFEDQLTFLDNFGKKQFWDNEGKLINGIYSIEPIECQVVEEFRRLPFVPRWNQVPSETKMYTVLRIGVLAEQAFIPCGNGDNHCNCKSESECGYKVSEEVKQPDAEQGKQPGIYDEVPAINWILSHIRRAWREGRLDQTKGFEARDKWIEGNKPLIDAILNELVEKSQPSTVAPDREAQLLKNGWEVDKASLKLYFELSKLQEKEIEDLKAQVKAKDGEIEKAWGQADRHLNDARELRGKVERLTELIKKAVPYIHDCQADNIHDPSVGLFEDKGLTDLNLSIEEVLKDKDELWEVNIHPTPEELKRVFAPTEAKTQSEWLKERMESQEELWNEALRFVNAKADFRESFDGRLKGLGNQLLKQFEIKRREQ